MEEINPSHERYLESNSTVYRIIVSVESYLGISLLIILFVAVLVQITDRMIVGFSISGTEELARYAFIWFTFVAAGFVAARRRHIGVQLFGGRSTGRVVSFIEAAAYLVIVVTGSVLVVSGVQLVGSTNHLVSPATGIPLAVIYASLPVGCVLLVGHAVLNMVVAIRHPAQFVEETDANEVVR